MKLILKRTLLLITLFASFERAQLGYAAISSVATNCTISGPAASLPASPGTYSLTLNGTYTGTVTLSDGGSGGTFTPASLTWSGAGAPQSFTYSNSTRGSYTLTEASSPALVNGTAAVVVRNAASYYISASGTDSNGGTSAESPWHTLGKVNGWAFLPGDSILFHGGDTFQGTLSTTLIGSPTAQITIGSYGAGRGVISSGVGDGITLTDPEFVTVDNLKVEGLGWTGTEPRINVLNGGNGIYFLVTRTIGQSLRNINVTHCVVSGYQIGIVYDATRENALGFTNVVIANNNVSNNLTFGIFMMGLHALRGGPVNQNSNVYVGGNILTNIQGDPYAGAGGVHGLVPCDGGGIGVQCVTGLTVEKNYLADIAGYGGSATSLLYGGSTAIGICNARNFRITNNEITRTKCTARFDGSAIDIDQDTLDGEIAYNLTYNNVGPSIQSGSFGGKLTGNVRIHHNISYNDVRGNSALTQQGAMRFWGNTVNTWLYNNSFYIDSAGTTGKPSAVSWEVIHNDGIFIANNLFKVTGGVPIFWANTGSNATHIGTPVVIQNVYDISGGFLLMSNDTGFVYRDITSLVSWRDLGHEAMNGILYGFMSNGTLPDIASFSPPEGGFLAAGWASMRGFCPGKPAIGTGIDPWMVGADLGPTDFFGDPARDGASVDLGAVSLCRRAP